MSRILLIGPGAVGGSVAAWLCEAGHSLTLALRTRFTSLTVETPAGRTIKCQPKILTQPCAPIEADWVLVALKTYDSSAACPWLYALADPVPVAILQNGVEHVARFSQWLAKDRILPVMVDIPAEREAPGLIRQRGRGVMRVPSCAAGRAFVELFAGTDLDVAEVEDFKTTLWRKLCINVAGAVSALTDQPGGVAWSEPAAQVMRALVRECVAVGNAEGATLDDSIADFVVDHYRKAPKDSVNSLHADRRAGRRMEWDSRNGVVSRLGRAHAIATPANDMVCGLFAAIEEAAAHLCPSSH